MPVLEQNPIGNDSWPIVHWFEVFIWLMSSEDPREVFIWLTISEDPFILKKNISKLFDSIIC